MEILAHAELRAKMGGEGRRHAQVHHGIALLVDASARALLEAATK